VAGVMPAARHDQSATLLQSQYPTLQEHQMGSMSIVHWMIVAAVAVLLFGKGKISDLMADVAQGIKSFKKGMQDDEPSA
jgi:TatA/E family protein of Tat protein translocase